MHIKKITIKNFRNFGDPAFEMKLKPFTLILGENNVGKSNLLNAIGLIFSQELSVFRRRMLEIYDINCSIVKGFKEAVFNNEISPEEITFPEVKIEVILAKMDDDQKSIVADWFIDQGLENAKITYLFAPKGNFDKKHWIETQRKKTEIEHVDFPIEEYRYSIFGGDDSSNECQQYLLRMLKMEYLDALRNAEQELVASGSARLLYRVLTQTDMSKYDGIKEASMRLESIVNENKALKKVKEKVGKLLSRVSLGDDKKSVDFQFSSPETSELLKKISLIYGTNPIDVSHNGLGRNNLLYIALILSHLSDKDKKGNEPYFRCIGIEEPEAHLHPQLQDHLAENIRSIQKDYSGSMQLLLTSHSTHIAAKLSLENTVILYRDEKSNEVKSHYILDGLDTKMDKESIGYLNKFLDASQSRLFFARKIILVEGISEKILMPEFFKKYCGNSLEQYGYEVINVQGVSFRHFLKIINKGYFKKCLVLTDSDRDKKTKTRARRLQRHFKGNPLIRIAISTSSTFEKDLIESNVHSKGKKILLKALKKTKPRKGEKFKAKTAGNDIDVNDFFKEIENYKSEFAFNLKRELERKRDEFVLPKYISEGFGFLEGKSGKD